MAHSYGIYGVGAIILIVTLRYFNKNNYTLFAGGCLVGSFVEYMMSYIGEILFDARWWDYSNRFLNINGRICLLYAIFWGILSLIVIKIINPQIDKFIEYIKSKVNLKILKKLVIASTIFLILDTIVSGIAMNAFLIRMSVENDLDVKNKRQVVEKYVEIYGDKKKSQFIRKYWGDEKMIKTYPNVTLTLENGNTIYVHDLLPNVKTYYYKF